MAFIKTDSQHYTNIATKIREKTGGGETYTPSKMPDGVESVYKAGKKAEYDHFWDAFQQNGERTSCTYMFASSAWVDDIFKPKYDIKPVSASHIFYGSDITDEGLKAALDRGISFDFSNTTDLNYAFSLIALTEIPFDVSFESINSSASGSGVFSYAYPLKTIKKIIFKADGSTPVPTSMFTSSAAIENVTFEGVIGGSLSMSACSKLSVASMKNIISCLANYSGTDKEFTYKLTFHETAWTRLEADSTAPTGTTWKEYVHSLGWNT